MTGPPGFLPVTHNDRTKVNDVVFFRAGVLFNRHSGPDIHRPGQAGTRAG
jgi:hypothetical protein